MKLFIGTKLNHCGQTSWSQKGRTNLGTSEDTRRIIPKKAAMLIALYCIQVGEERTFFNIEHWQKMRKKWRGSEYDQVAEEKPLGSAPWAWKGPLETLFYHTWADEPSYIYNAARYIFGG